MLDLRVGAGVEHQFPVAVIACEVARAVHSLGVARLRGVLHERGGGALGVVIVAERNAGSAQIDSPRLPRAHGMTVSVEQQHARIAEGSTDRNRLALFQFAIRPPIAGHSRGFGRTVEVEKGSLRERLPPQPVLLGRKDLAAERDGAQVLGRVLFEHTERGNHSQRRDDPTNRIDAVLVEEVAQLHGKQKECLGDEIGGCAEFDDGHQLLERCVEEQRGLVGEHAGFVKAERVREGFGIVDDRAVAGNHAFGRSG